MIRVFALTIFLMISACSNERTSDAPAPQKTGTIALVIHGGAGTITASSMTAEKERLYHEKLREALDRGYAMLDSGRSSMDAVIEVIAILEDSPLFNAGKGSVLTHDGRNEMDASVMDGGTGKAGAVAGVGVIKNPIRAARAVMDHSEHVLLSGKGAEEFATKMGLEIVEPSYFFDSARWQSLQRELKKESESANQSDKKHGTVGCVALDVKGNIAAGTSTGGMTNKRYGRIGDSPIIGAGTFADNRTCGISSTGHGEYFIRLAVAHDISAMMEYGHLSLEQAANKAIMEKLTKAGGTGGVIGLTAQGDIVMTFNTEGMYRGFKRRGEEARTFIYK